MKLLTITEGFLSVVLFSYLLRDNYFHEPDINTSNPDIYIFSEKYDLFNKYLLALYCMLGENSKKPSLCVQGAFRVCVHIHSWSLTVSISQA